MIASIHSSTLYFPRFFDAIVKVFALSFSTFLEQFTWNVVTTNDFPSIRLQQLCRFRPTGLVGLLIRWLQSGCFGEKKGQERRRQNIERNTESWQKTSTQFSIRGFRQDYYFSCSLLVLFLLQNLRLLRYNGPLLKKTNCLVTIKRWLTISKKLFLHQDVISLFFPSLHATLARISDNDIGEILVKDKHGRSFVHVFTRLLYKDWQTWSNYRSWLPGWEWPLLTFLKTPSLVLFQCPTTAHIHDVSPLL